VLALPPIESAPGTNDGGNAIVFAAVGETMAIDPQTLRESAVALEKLTGLKLARTLSRLECADSLMFSGHTNKKVNTRAGLAHGKKMLRNARKY
jgi:hypothetical protein